MDGWRIVVTGISSQIEGSRWEASELLRIGRQDNFEIVLDDPSVSRRHAEVRRTADGWTIRDLGSTNGTSVNNVELAGEARRLQANDLIKCGALFLRVAALEEPRSEPPQPGLSRFNRKSEPPKPFKTSGTYVKIQAHSQNTWEKALEMAAFAPDARSCANQHLAVLLRTGYHLTHIGSLDELLQSILAEVVAVLDAQRATILLHDETTKQLRLRKVVMAGNLPAPESRCYSQTLVQRCFDQGESLLCEDTSTAVDLQNTQSISQGAMASIVCALLRTPRQPIGVLHADRSVRQQPFTQDDFYLADALAATMSVGIECARLVEREREQFIQTVTALARTVDVRDRYTINHSQRVTDYSLLIAASLGISAADMHALRVGTPLHDIGKIGIPDAILRKAGKLTDVEFVEMRSHTLKGVAILEPIPALAPMLPIVRNHHERWDGSGYPDKLAGENISPLARIVAVADAFDAMTSNRPYRPALSAQHAYRELSEKKGVHFDAKCAEAFLDQRRNVEKILDREGMLRVPQALIVPGPLDVELAF